MDVPEVCVVQVVPPLPVCKIVPYEPTAHPLFKSTKVTACRILDVPEACVVQVVPPLPVRKIVPLAPTAHPLFESTKVTSYR